MDDVRLLELIHQVHAESDGSCGSPRVHAELRHRGICVARKRVERLMRRHGLSGLVKRRKGKTTIRVPGVRPAPDLVGRDFRPAEPNRLWVADLTEVQTWEGKLYLATVLDCFSRRVVGWAMAEHMRAELVVEALEMAVRRRKPAPGLVHHSDQGAQGGFNRSSQHLNEEVAMGRPAGWVTELTERCPLKSPGAPSLRRDVERRFWHEVAKGLSSEEAALAVGASQAAGSRWFRERGGMATFMLRPLAGRYLSFEEREEIALLRAQGLGVREIAGRVGRHPSTVSRELRRNAATRGGKLEYRASVAQWKAELMARRAKTAKLAANERLREYVQDRLAGQVRRHDGTAVSGPATARWKGRSKPRRADRRWASAWSPEQISARLKIDFPEDDSMRISHEAIYQALFVQGRGALRRELVACLRTGRALRVPRARAQGRGKTFVTDEVMISQRPAEAADRAVPGHWEGDLIVGIERSGSAPSLSARAGS